MIFILAISFLFTKINLRRLDSILNITVFHTNWKKHKYVCSITDNENLI